MLLARNLDIQSTLRDIPTAARAGGVDGVVLWPIVGGVNLTTLSATGYRDLAHSFSAMGQRIGALELAVATTPPIDIGRQLDRVRRLMEAAVKLNCRLVVVSLGMLPAAPEAPPPPQIDAGLLGSLILPTKPSIVPAPRPVSRNPQLEADVHTLLTELGALADRMSVRLAFGSELSTTSDLAHAVTRVSCPMFGCVMDAVSVMQDELLPDVAMDRLRPVLVVGLRDAKRGAPGRTAAVPLGRGDVPLAELLQLAAQLPETVPLVLAELAGQTLADAVATVRKNQR
jgi:sugar phosphate isomerase/epimerase